MAIAEPKTTAAAPPTWRPWTWAFKSATLVCLALAAYHFYYLYLGSNFHVVVPGECYRCAQLSSTALESFVQAHGIRTVVNLRGEHPEAEWFREETAAMKKRGVAMVHISMAAAAPTAGKEFAQLAETLRSAEKPILIHCQGGADRSGVGAAAFRLLNTNDSPEQARKQLSFRFGHVFFGRARVQHEVLDLYETWLAENRLTHNADRFQTWATQVYFYPGGPFTADGPQPHNRPFQIAETADVTAP